MATLLGVDPASVRNVEDGRSVGRAVTEILAAFLSHCDADRDLATLALPRRRTPNERPVSLDTIGDHIRTRRLDLGLSLEVTARQLDCSVGSVLNWELNRRAASIRNMPAILAFLGYDPYTPPATLAELLHAIRRERGLTQAELASLIGVAESTVTSWETHSTEPTGRGAPKLWGFLNNERPAELRRIRKDKTTGRDGQE